MTVSRFRPPSWWCTVSIIQLWIVLIAVQHVRVARAFVFPGGGGSVDPNHRGPPPASLHPPFSSTGPLRSISCIRTLSSSSSSSSSPPTRRTTTTPFETSTSTALFAKRAKQRKGGGGRSGRRSRRGKNDDDDDNDSDTGDDDDATSEKKKKKLSSSSTNLQPSSSEHKNLIPQPTQTRKVKICLDRPPNKNIDNANDGGDNRPPGVVPIYVYQVQDVTWWNHKDNTNPFGARCWPSSMGLANYLTSSLDPAFLQHENRTILELGCGPGLPSLAAAACGAKNVIASDISPVALTLLRDGWKATRTKMNQRSSSSFKKQKQQGQDEESSSIPADRLSAIYFDIFSKEPLPLPPLQSASATVGGNKNDSSNINHATPMVLAAAMMYDADLAVAVARRVYEACHVFGAWVIFGDDDTGERDGGRHLFLEELARLEKANAKANENAQAEEEEDAEEQDGTTTNLNENPKNANIPLQRVWEKLTVRNDALGWQEKQVWLLHLNPPTDVGLLLEEANQEATAMMERL